MKKSLFIIMLVLFCYSLSAQTVLQQMKHNFDSGLHVLKQSFHSQKAKPNQNTLNQPSQNNSVNHIEQQSNSTKQNQTINTTEYIHIIDKPTGHYVGLPFIYNNKLYIKYNTGTNHLTEFDGSTLKIMPNVDSLDRGYSSSPIVYKNKLYFLYGAKYRAELAQFDGNKITIIPSFDPHYQYNGYYASVIYDDKLYMQFIGSLEKLVVFDGETLQLAKDDFSAQYLSPMLVYKNKLYLSPDIRGGVYVYDGNKSVQFPQKFNITNFCLIYNDRLLMLTPKSPNFGSHSRNWALWDGNNVEVVPLPDDSASVSDIYNTAVYNNSLYFFVNYPLEKKDAARNVAGNYAADYHIEFGNNPSLDDDIAVYDGKKIVIFKSPENGNYTSKIVVCNNKLYTLLTNPADREIPNAKNKTQLVECDGNSLKLIPNPGDSSLDTKALIAYNNKIYVQYEHKLAVYDGKSISIIPSEYKLDTDWYPVVFNNKLYFAVNLQLGYYDGSQIQ